MDRNDELRGRVQELEQELELNRKALELKENGPPSAFFGTRTLIHS